MGVAASRVAGMFTLGQLGRWVGREQPRHHVLIAHHARHYTEARFANVADGCARHGHPADGRRVGAHPSGMGQFFGAAFKRSSRVSGQWVDVEWWRYLVTKEIVLPDHLQSFCQTILRTQPAVLAVFDKSEGAT